MINLGIFQYWTSCLNIACKSFSVGGFQSLKTVRFLSKTTSSFSFFLSCLATDTNKAFVRMSDRKRINLARWWSCCTWSSSVTYKLALSQSCKGPLSDWRSTARSAPRRRSNLISTCWYSFSWKCSDGLDLPSRRSSAASTAARTSLSCASVTRWPMCAFLVSRSTGWRTATCSSLSFAWLCRPMTSSESLFGSFWISRSSSSLNGLTMSSLRGRGIAGTHHTSLMRHLHRMSAEMMSLNFRQNHSRSRMGTTLRPSLRCWRLHFQAVVPQYLLSTASYT